MSLYIAFKMVLRIYTPITIGVSRIYKGVTGIAQRYKEARSAMEFRLIYEEENVILYENTISDRNNEIIDYGYESHSSVCVLNLTDTDATITMTACFADEEPSWYIAIFKGKQYDMVSCS